MHMYIDEIVLYCRRTIFSSLFARRQCCSSEYSWVGYTLIMTQYCTVPKLCTVIRFKLDDRIFYLNAIIIYTFFCLGDMNANERPLATKRDSRNFVEKLLFEDIWFIYCAVAFCQPFSSEMKENFTVSSTPHPLARNIVTRCLL